MKIELTADDFTTDSTFFYSVPFLYGKTNEFIAVEVELTVTGEVTLQAATDEIFGPWADITDSTFDCGVHAVQIYAGGHPDLFYRLKTTQEVDFANILI